MRNESEHEKAGLDRGFHRGGFAGLMSWVLLIPSVQAGPKSLVQLEKDHLHAGITCLDTQIVGHEDAAVVIQTGQEEDWPNITFNATDRPWNLKGYATVKADFTNLGSAPVRAGLKLVSDRGAGHDRPQQAQGFEQFEPGETRTLTLRLTTEPWIFKDPLHLVGMRRAPGVELLNVGKIKSIQVFSRNSGVPQRYMVSHIRAEGVVKPVDSKGFLPFVDAYGQFKHHDWPEKIHGDADFATARAVEEKDLAAHPGPANLSRYGGWKGGAMRKATGFFRVEKVDGKWWFVDPEGYLFWSNGPTCMNPDFGYTGVEFRESYFENLPGDDRPLAQFYSQSDWAPHGFYEDKIPFRIFQYYKANLYRKYGKDWAAAFRDTAHRRLKSWGMNTVANWAQPELYLQQRTPYTANFFIRGNKTLAGSKGYWGSFHDVFDPSFRKSIKQELAGRTTEAQDPWCIGFFVDNEMSWGHDDISLALETLASPAEQAAKQVFVEDLKAKYGSIDTLNRIWGTGHASWQALLESQNTPDPKRAEADLQQFYAKTADTYFRTVREELKKAAPNHLYLGCRFAWVTDTAAHAAALYCDVVSYNKYLFSIRNIHHPHYIDRPIVIGEYHFGSTDRGHFHPGLRDAGTQKGRGEKYAAYLKSALDNPLIVGIHWFQYVDEHSAGRADGENYNVGLVDICDTPYPEMVKAIRHEAQTMYEYRLDKQAGK